SFQAEAKQATHVADAVLWVFNASAGVKTELEKLWEYAAERSLPGLIFISGLDRKGTAWAALVEELEKAMEIKTVPLSLPIGQQSSLEGVVDLLSGEAYRYAADASGRRQKAEVPAALGGQVEGARKKLMEGAAEADDQLLEKYLSDGMLTAQEILQGLKSGVTTRSLFPVLCGSAGNEIGTVQALTALVALLPSPVRSEEHTSELQS